MAPEPEPGEDRRRHVARLHDEERRAARDRVLPARVDERAVDAAPTCRGQDGAAHQRDAGSMSIARPKPTGRPSS